MAQKKRDNNKSDSRDSKKRKFDMNPFDFIEQAKNCLLYTSPSPRDTRRSRMPSSA